MNFLVQYLQDKIYHISKKQFMKKKNNTLYVKWLDRVYYPAKVISFTSGNLKILRNVCNNLNTNFPKIVLDVTDSGVTDLPEANVVKGPDYEKCEDFLVCRYCGLLLKNLDQHIESYHSGFSSYSEVGKSCTGDHNLCTDDDSGNRQMQDVELYENCSLYNSNNTDDDSGNRQIQDVELYENCSLYNSNTTDDDSGNRQIQDVELDENRSLYNSNTTDDDSGNRQIQDVELDENRSLYNSNTSDKISYIPDGKRLEEPDDNLPVYSVSNLGTLGDEYSPVRKVDYRNSSVQTSTDNCKKYYCSYCEKMITNFGRHLLTVHRDVNEVKAILLLPKGNSLRMNKINDIRTHAQYIYNTEKNHGSIIVKRRPNQTKYREANHYKHCPSCHDMFSKLSLRTHYKKCTKTDQLKKTQCTNIFQASKRTVMNVHIKANNRLIRDVLASCKDDDITNCFLFDELCILYGNKLTMKYRDSHLNGMISQRLREMGRFLYEFKKIRKDVSSLKEVLNPINYDDIVLVINNIAGLAEDGQYRAPSTAYNLGLHLKSVARILETEYIKEQNFEKRNEIRDLLCLMNEGFTTDINKTVSENQLENRRHKHIVMPSNFDITCLQKYVSKGLEENIVPLKHKYSYKHWKALAEFTMVNIQLFNRRRAGEIELIKISDFKTFRFTDLNDETIKKQTITVQNIAKNFGRFFIRGKLNRTVPVILDKISVDAINLILHYRDVSGVPETNPYVFGIEGRNRYAHLRACNLMRVFSKACGASNPSALRGTELRKHVATRCSMEKLPDPLVERIANHLGHKLDIHKAIYRQPEELEVPEIVPILKKCLGVDLESDDESEYPTIQNQQEEYHMNEPPIIIDEPTNFEQGCRITTDKPCLKTQNCMTTPTTNKITNTDVSSTDPGHLSTTTKRVSWSSLEKEAVNTSFKEMIDYGIVPTYQECNELRENFQCLRKRTPPQIKSFVAYQTKKIQKEALKTCKRTWKTPERHLVRSIFKDYLEKKKLPCLKLCENIISKYPIFSGRTPQQLKAYINNLNKKSENILPM